MRLHVLILSILLFWVSGSRSIAVEAVPEAAGCAVAQSSQDKAEDNSPDFKSVGILPSRAAGYSGGENSVTTSVRSSNSGRRLQPSGKASFRVIKAGKVIDRQRFHTFRTSLKQHPSGTHSSNRYIHSICQLLI